MWSLLDPRIWLAFALACAVSGGIGFYKGQNYGKSAIKAEWITATARANAEARSLEQQRQRRADEAMQLASASARDDADRRRRADRAASGLRDALDAAERRAIESDDAAALYRATLRAVFESCTAEYRALGEEAAGHARDSLMYQRAFPK